MLGALKFIPRDEVERYAEKKESSRGRSRKRKHKDSVKGKSKSREKKKRARSSDSEGTGRSSGTSHDSDREIEASSVDLKEDAKTRRKEAGLGWMLHAPERPFGVSAPSEGAHETSTLDSEGTPWSFPQKPQSHVRELNPHIASGESEKTVQKTPLPLIGDGGASWRLKALKRAQEQAAREGRKLDEIVEERWESLGTLTSSVAVKRSAHVNAHLHAIRDRKSRRDGDGAEGGANRSTDFERGSSRGPGGDRRHDSQGSYGSQMRVPRTDYNLSGKSTKKSHNQPLRDADAAIVRAAANTFNKYASDGSFIKSFKTEGEVADSSTRPTGDKESLQKSGGQGSPRDTFDVIYEPTRLFETSGKHLESSSDNEEEPPQSKSVKPPQSTAGRGSSTGLSANQVAAKAMRLRLAGRAKEGDDLLKDFEASSKGRSPQRPSTQDFGIPSGQAERLRQVTRPGLGMSSVEAQDKLRARNNSYDAEMVRTIAHNKSYKGNEDDEYDDFGNGMETERVYEKKGNKKKLADEGMKPNGQDYRQIATRQEQCQYCFENPRRAKHLVIAIANHTYLMLPPSTSFVPFHCYIVPMQHDGATRNVDEPVWQELRNFKKCLVQMFGDQGKEVLFLETAMGLARQRRHCFIECIPVPPAVAKDAPLYFKKAIDEVEEEWSQHNSKKLIDTRQKGLRNSIPKNFPYFHVEFGIQGGYCHVIDDESAFKPQFGRDVIAGMLERPEEGNRRQDSVEQQRAKVKEFLKLWEPFDWTKMLD